MSNKLTKLVFNGEEYEITDKEAQQIAKVLEGKVDELEKDYKELKDYLTWQEI